MLDHIAWAQTRAWARAPAFTFNFNYNVFIMILQCIWPMMNERMGS